MLEAQKFLDQVFVNLERAGVDVAGFELDHLCYRVETLEEYRRFKTELVGKANLLHEAVIGGRPIATYELRTPIHYQRSGIQRKISILELPSPKPGSPYRSGLEHVEFVIDESFEAFLARYPQLIFDMSGANKASNPEVRLSFEDCSVKFHHQSLKEVIALETQAKGQET